MITAKITSIKLFNSRYGGNCYLVCFKDDKGKTYNTYIYVRMRNWIRWKKVLVEGRVLSNLRLVKGKTRLIDADSRFEVK